MKLKELLNESNVKEFKWQKLKDAKYRFCAIKLINAVWDLIQSDDARVDTIIWDTNDSRHQVSNRDDIANYGRMFYHLHSNSLTKRPRLSTWKIYPDEGVGVDWDVVARCIDARGRRREQIDFPLFATKFFDDPYYRITDFKEVKSHEEPCCQIADLFAGISIFSRIHFNLYEQWLESTELSLALFPQERPNITNSQGERFEVLKHLDQGCKTRRLGVSLKTNRYLQTPDPKNPINFWHYTPQHEMDKAPTKKTV